MIKGTVTGDAVQMLVTVGLEGIAIYRTATKRWSQ
jgi:hypothetical protein